MQVEGSDAAEDNGDGVAAEIVEGAGAGEGGEEDGGGGDEGEEAELDVVEIASAEQNATDEHVLGTE